MIIEFEGNNYSIKAKNRAIAIDMLFGYLQRWYNASYLVKHNLFKGEK